MAPQFTSHYQMPSDDTLREQVKALCLKLSAAGEEHEKGIYAQIVDAGLRYVVDAKRVTLGGFRKVLQEEGLSPERVSEITVLLKAPGVARRFAQGECGVKAALEEARRTQLPKRGRSRRTAQQLAQATACKSILSAIERLIKQKPQEAKDWVFERESYQIRYRPRAFTPS